MATYQTCNVKCESYANSIIPRIYDSLVRGSMGDCILSAEGKFIRAHKLILSISSEYFENMFNISGMEKPIIVVSGLKFSDLCLILDFAYIGQAQVPHERLDDFIKAGELLQIRGIKEGRIHFMNNNLSLVHQTANRSFDQTISSSTQQSYSEPQSKRPREDDEITIQEASEIMKMLLDTNSELEVEQVQDKTTAATLAPNAAPMTLLIPSGTTCTQKTIMPNQPPRLFMAPSPVIKPKSILDKEKPKYPCRFCDRTLSTPGRIKKHENECCNNPDRVSVVCEICNVEMKPSSLTQHNNTKHGGKGKNMQQIAKTSEKVQLAPFENKSSSYQMNAADTTLISSDASIEHDASPNYSYDALSDEDMTLLQIKQEMKDGLNNVNSNEDKIVVA